MKVTTDQERAQFVSSPELLCGSPISGVSLCRAVDKRLFRNPSLQNGGRGSDPSSSRTDTRRSEHPGTLDITARCETPGLKALPALPAASELELNSGTLTSGWDI